MEEQINSIKLISMQSIFFTDSHFMISHVSFPFRQLRQRKVQSQRQVGQVEMQELSGSVVLTQHTKKEFDCEACIEDLPKDTTLPIDNEEQQLYGFSNENQIKMSKCQGLIGKFVLFICETVFGHTPLPSQPRKFVPHRQAS